MTTTKQGEVYLAKCGKHYKIGKTKRSAAKRISGLQSGNPEPIYLIKAIQVSDTSDVESELHFLMKHNRKSGEWFDLDKEAVDFLLEVMEERHGN